MRIDQVRTAVMNAERDSKDRIPGAPSRRLQAILISDEERLS